MRAERLWCSKTHLCPCDITEETAETGNFVNEHTCMIALCAAGCRTFVFCLLIADPRQQSFLFYLGYVCTTGMNSMSRSVHSRTPSRGHLSKDGRRRAAAVWRSQRKREIQVATPPPPLSRCLRIVRDYRGFLFVLFGPIYLRFWRRDVGTTA